MPGSSRQAQGNGSSSGSTGGFGEHPPHLRPDCCSTGLLKAPRAFVTIISKGLLRDILKPAFPAECSVMETEGGTKLHQTVITEALWPQVGIFLHHSISIPLQQAEGGGFLAGLFAFKVNHHWQNKYISNGLLQLRVLPAVLCLTFSKNSNISVYEGFASDV